MTSLRAVVSDEVRVIMCVAFDQRAPVAEIDRFKKCLLDCEQVLHAVESTGTFDLMVEVRVASLAEYNERLGVLRATVGHLIARSEANFICRRFVQHARHDEAIWVPCQDGKLRVDHGLIDKVTAEGDYMRLHCGKTSHLIHMTMHAISEALGEDFVLVHRSMLIRRNFIDRLLHRNFKWIARLNDGSQVKIAKSHVAEVMSRLHIASAKIQEGSSNREEVIESSRPAPSKSTGEVDQRKSMMSLPAT